MEIEKLPIHIALEAGELAALLDMGGPASPPSLRNELGTADGFSKSGLDQVAATGLVDRANGELTGAGRTLTHTLLSPGSILSLEYRDTNGYAGRITVQFPDIPAAGSGIVVNRSNGWYHVSGFADAETILALVGPIPPLNSPGDFPSLEAVLNMDQAAVFCAILDALARRFEENENRKTAGIENSAALAQPELAAISARRINDHLAVWWGTSSPNRLLAQVFALALTQNPPEPAKVAGILDGFVSAGLLEQRNDTFAPVGVTSDLARAAVNIEAGFLWEQVHINLGDDRQPEGTIKRYLLGGRGVSFSFGLLGETMLELRTETPQDIAAFIARELAGRPAKPISDSARTEGKPETRSSQNFCEQCGHRLVAGSKFCEQCGHAVPTARPSDGG